MNAPIKHSHFASPFGEAPKGVLLYSGFQMTDTLQVDLYGDLPDQDDGYTVQSVTVRGHCIDISGLISGHALEKMGEWLDFKDDTNPNRRAWAMNAKHEAMRIDF